MKMPPCPPSIVKYKNMHEFQRVPHFSMKKVLKMGKIRFEYL
jgi:hypothetical protein